MNPSAASKGASFTGAVGYITHDVGRSTAERVEFTEVLNMRTNDPTKAAKVMAWTAMHAGELKEAAGVKATGRKTTNPVYHFSLNWEPGETVPHTEMVKAAKSSLAALGYEHHEAVFAVHTDKAHQHIHIVVNRVSPETGKTHNPNNDYEALQRWAYQYEKDRGQVVCLERAIKYEKDKSLKDEYTRRLTAELEAGKKRDSKPRPQWEAEKDATHPKSQRYKALKERLADRVRGLAELGRAIAQRQATDWAQLKAKHEKEKVALRKKQQTAFKNRQSFNRASTPIFYSWKAYQVDRAALRGQHAVEARTLRAQFKVQDVPTVLRFKEGQKAAWRTFYRLERAKDRGQLDKTLKIITATPVGKQGPEHRDHLAKLFNAKVHVGARKIEFGQVLNMEKKAFLQTITDKNASAWTALKQGQQEQLKALRLRLDQSRDAQRARASTVVAAQDIARQERAELEAQQRSERVATRAKHATETAGQQKAWATLNADRAEAWGAYKQLRQAQMKGQATAGKPADRSHLFADFKPAERSNGAPGGTDRDGPGLDRDR